MTSSRLLRRSRRSSPMDIPIHGSEPMKFEAQVEDRNGSVSDEWIEPPLRAPAPSFEDYKGLERHGVLEHMAPLGTFPGTKVKARLKQHEHPRRNAPLKNGDVKRAREEVETPEPAPVASPTPAVAARRSEPRRLEEKQPKVSTLRGGVTRDADPDFTPDGNVKTTPVKASPTQVHMRGNSAARTTAPSLLEVVEKAMERARQVGDQTLGIAIKQTYEDGLSDQSTADVLQAVLTQKATTAQVAEFQAYIKAAKKKVKAGDIGLLSYSKSPTAKSARTSVTLHLGSPHDRSGTHLLSPKSNHRSSRHRPTLMETNGSPSKDERPPKRIKRSGSVSSDSSLSSVGSAIEEYAPALESTLPSLSNQLLTNNHNQGKSQRSMGPRLGSFSTRPADPSTRRSAIPQGNPSFVPAARIPVDDATEKRKQLLKKNFSDFISRDSAIRTPPTAPPAQPSPPLTALSERAAQSRLRNGTNLRSKRDDYEGLDSPTSSSYGELLAPPPPGAARGATPTALGRPRKEFKAKAARVKMSPMKKAKNVTAGIGRGPETEGTAISSYGRNVDGQEHENSDVCSACSGSGQLLCCDGCSRAYHFTCLDPPLDADKPPQGSWFCYKCLDARVSHDAIPRGAFRELLGDLNRKNPTAFKLPGEIREYFEGVKTGDEGEYEEASSGKAKQTRTGYEELPNNFKLRDTKNDWVLCFRCGESSRGNREIIPCDFCNLSWHLDCLDPPLATAPRRTANGKTKATWMCPNHIEHDLASIRSDAKVSMTTAKRVQPATGRTYKIRRPKNASIVDIGLRRGFKNNGLIEIENDSSEEESEIEREYPPGVVFLVPEKGVKLDFIDRIKRQNQIEAQARELASKSSNHRRNHKRAPSTATSTNTLCPTVNGERTYQDEFNKRSFTERKAALNLAQLASSSGTPISGNKVQNLIAALTAEAPTDVEKLFADQDNAPSPPSDQERKDLKALEALIRHRLGD